MERKEGEELKLQLDSCLAGSVLVPKSQESHKFKRKTKAQRVYKM